MVAVPVPRMSSGCWSGCQTLTMNRQVAGTDPGSRDSSKVSVSVAPSTAALDKVGGVLSVLLVTASPLKLATSMPSESVSLSASAAGFA